MVQDVSDLQQGMRRNSYSGCSPKEESDSFFKKIKGLYVLRLEEIKELRSLTVMELIVNNKANTSLSLSVCLCVKM